MVSVDSFPVKDEVGLKPVATAKHLQPHTTVDSDGKRLSGVRTRVEHLRDPRAPRLRGAEPWWVHPAPDRESHRGSCRASGSGARLPCTRNSHHTSPGQHVPGTEGHGIAHPSTRIARALRLNVGYDAHEADSVHDLAVRFTPRRDAARLDRVRPIRRIARAARQGDRHHDHNGAAASHGWSRPISPAAVIGSYGTRLRHRMGIRRVSAASPTPRSRLERRDPNVPPHSTPMCC